MAKLQLVKGSTSVLLQVFIQDSSSTTGAGLTGLAFNSGSLTAYYHRDTDTTATAITLATMTVGTFTSSGFKEIDATNMPGWYQLCPPNAALASGAKSVAIHLKGASNMAPLPLEIELTAVDNQSATAFMTSVATAVAVTTVNGLAAGVITAASIASAALAAAKFAADTGLVPIRSGTAQAGAATTITLDASASAVDNFYLNDLVFITGGTGAGQARFVSGYVGTTKVATVGTWATNPDNTSTFAVLPSDATLAPSAATIATAVWATSCTEPAAVVAASPAVLAAISWLLTMSRNTINQTATAQVLKADDGTTTIATSTVSDNGTTAVRGEFA